MPVPIPVMKRATSNWALENEVVCNVAPTYTGHVSVTFVVNMRRRNRETHNDPRHGKPH
jgi:hypothetical protein